jgi:hypothetical protein
VFAFDARAAGYGNGGRLRAYGRAISASAYTKPRGHDNKNSCSHDNPQHHFSHPDLLIERFRGLETFPQKTARGKRFCESTCARRRLDLPSFEPHARP